ncbi:hypothetical protein QPK87_21290 [Kamptonema cortianum]|nr:hypothetical protein [Kamptonema cortianum]
MIAIVSTFKESYKDVREHLPQWIKVAFAPFIVWLIGLAFMGMGLYLSGEFNFTVTQEGILQNEPEGSLLGDFFYRCTLYFRDICGAGFIRKRFSLCSLR